MDTPLIVRETDISGDVAQFLLSVRIDDLVTEFVQNELDAGSSRTVIEFREDTLVCEGNGRPIGDAGWRRLRLVKAVSAQLEKRDGIGSKNHGLRVGFHLGDEIIVQSNARETRLLLCGEGVERGFDPAAWAEPIPQCSAPSAGCRVTIPYRTGDLKVPGRDGFILAARGPNDIESLFDQAVSNMPQRVIGVICPGQFNHYDLEIRHWRLGRFRFEYKAKSLPGTKGRTWFRRLCRKTGPNGRSGVVLREEAHTFPIEMQGLQRQQVPTFYRGKGKIVGELSWEIDANGTPKIRPGKLRYPLEYPDGDLHSYSELGIHFSAPFVSDPVRRGASEVTEKNARLRRLCEDRVPRVLRHRLVPQFGPKALELLRNPDKPPGDVTKRIALLAAIAGALPAANAKRGRRRKRSAKTRRTMYRCVPSASRSASSCSFAIPCYYWERDRIDRVLSQLCPSSVAQLHPGMPRFVVRILTDQFCLFTEDADAGRFNRDDPSIRYAVFDQDDALRRMQPALKGNYPWDKEDDWQRELGDPSKAKLYLDVVAKCLDSDTPDEKTKESLLQNGLLPNDQKIPARWSDLLWSPHPVPEIPGVGRSNVLHPDLPNVKILHEGPLKLALFNLDERLSHLNWEPVMSSGRRLFFNWLRHTPIRLKRETLQAIAAYPIWPASEDSWVRLHSFCEPKSRRVATVLNGYILRTSKSVRQVKGVSKGGRGPLALRTVPTEQELRDWYEHYAPVSSEMPLTARERAELDRLERGILILRQDRVVRPITEWIADRHRTIDGNVRLKRVSELHVPTEHVKACGLLAENIAGGRHHRLYQSLGARTRPSSEALARALQEDAANQKLLYRRIDAYTRISEDPKSLRDIPLIRLRNRGRLYSPSELALPGKPDYWGKWKVKCNLPSLTPDREANLVEIGVTNGTPDWDSSKDFFRWLSDQSEERIRDHLTQVLRHWLHPQKGPLRWWEWDTRLPCLPVQTLHDRIRLVSRYESVRSSSKVYLPDFREIEEQMLRLDQWRSVAIVEVLGVSGSILSKLKEKRVQSLRSACRQPISVWGNGDESRAPELEEKIKELTSRRFRQELPKRLEEQDLSSKDLRRAWPSLLKGITQVRIAGDVTATFKLGHYQYRVVLPSVVDPRNSTLWITDGPNPQLLMYKAIAELIFKEGTSKYAGYALSEAVSMEFRSRVTIDKRDRKGLQDEETDEEAPESSEEKEQPPRKGEGVKDEGRKRVHGAKEDFVVPNPRRMRRRKQSEYQFDPSNERTKRRKEKTSTTGRKTSPQEEAEKQDLKERHYAWHCQACLGSHQVSEIAPRPSYGYRLRHRRPIIEAHHVHHVGKEGPRGTGNLMVLCDHHHQLLGDRMSQSTIRAKLRDEAQPTIRRFPADKDGRDTKKISGKVITLDLDVVPYSVQLFFTKAHAEVWRTDR